MTFTRRTAIALAFGVSLFSGLAYAGSAAKFDQTGFNAAVKSGKPVLVEVAADWCPTCKAQGPILEKLRAEGRFKDLKSFTVDFDSQKDALRALKVSQQSTIIVFKGGSEVGRSVGDTNPASLEALVAKAL